MTIRTIKSIVLIKKIMVQTVVTSGHFQNIKKDSNLSSLFY